MNFEIRSSCRICLEPKGVFPIFESTDCESILAKLSLCLKEKIEDIDGYPRNICKSCSSTIDTICEFIHKYEETNKILNNKVVEVKIEHTEEDRSDHYDDDFVQQSLISILKNVPKPEPVVKDPAVILSSLQEITIKKLDNKGQLINNIGKCNAKVQRKQITNAKKVTKCNIKSGTQNKILSRTVKSSTNIKIKEKKVIKTRKVRSKKDKHEETKETEGSEKQMLQVTSGRLCEICGKHYSKSLKQHQKEAHFDKRVICKECPNKTIYASKLEEHIKTHKKPNYICDLCGNSYDVRKSLTGHIRMVHVLKRKRKTIKIYKCRFCDKECTYRRGIIIHERSVHTGERPSVCSVCNSRFYDEVYLREHMRLHTGDNPFKCPICSRGYAQRGNMKSHMRNHKISELDHEVLKKLKPNYLKFLRP